MNSDGAAQIRLQRVADRAAHLRQWLFDFAWPAPTSVLDESRKILARFMDPAVHIYSMAVVAAHHLNAFVVLHREINDAVVSVLIPTNIPDDPSAAA